jgi:DNA-binding transcriptional LysR family regulator
MSSDFQPTLTALRAIESLARSGSVSHTAIALGLTQSAVSRSIAGLEKAAGIELVQRNARPLRLTAEGELVATHARGINASIDTLGERLAALRQNTSGSVRVGSSGPSASTRILPPLMQKFARRHAGIAVNIQEATDAETLLDLRADLLDVAVLGDPGPEFETFELARDQLVGLVSQTGPLASRKLLAPADLASQAFIMTLAGSGSSILEWFHAADQEPRIEQRVQQTVSIVALVEAGLGNAIVTRLSLPPIHPGVALVALRDAPTRTIVLARKHGQPHSRAAQLFWQFMRV